MKINKMILGYLGALILSTSCAVTTKEEPQFGRSNEVDISDSTLLERYQNTDRAFPGEQWDRVGELKSAYSLLSETPTEYLREFMTDRPDKTLTPVTVDAGHYQVEIDLSSFEFDREPQPEEGGLKDKRLYRFGRTNLRVGVTNNTDLHMFISPLELLEQPAPRLGTATPGKTQSLGFGDAQFMLKHNLWGNEGGPTALGVAEYVFVPVGDRSLTSGAYEGGASVFWLRRFPNKTYLGIEFGIEARENVKDKSYHAEFLNSVSLAWSLFGPLSTKIEIASVVSMEDSRPWEGVFATALLLSLNKSTQLDIGLNKGLSTAATNFNPYAGFSVRF